jgi:aspartate aminotransferase
MSTIDVTAAIDAAAEEGADRRGLSRMAQSLQTSEILTIAYDVRDRIASGADILNLTVGDFSADQYPLLPELRQGVVAALDAGHSNYPPAPGVPELRRAVRGLYERRLGLRYGIDSIIVAGGARPLIAGTYLTLVNEGDGVVFGTPSWNNDHYTNLTRAEAIELPTSPASSFFPDPRDLRGVASRARLVVVNTPQNPTGTVIPEADLRAVTEVVVEDNERRKRSGERALYILFDHIYWMLTFDGAEHRTPVQLVPESAPYVVHVDGISKGFAATGLRVGWGVGPKDVMTKMTSILTHLGCWAPRPEQVATAEVLGDDAVLDRHMASIRAEAGDRLRLLSEAVQAAKAAGHGIDAIAPEGAIYLSIKLDLRGKTTPEGARIESDEDVRTFLLDEAGIALIPFRAFGAADGSGWFRASVGTVSREQCASVKDRLLRAFSKLR